MHPTGVFERLEYPHEVFKSGPNAGKPGFKKDLPLREVLRYFQEEDFREELFKIGVIGFDRFGRFAVPVNYPYARRHVSKVGKIFIRTLTAVLGTILSLAETVVCSGDNHESQRPLDG